MNKKIISALFITLCTISLSASQHKFSAYTDHTGSIHFLDKNGQKVTKAFIFEQLKTGGVPALCALNVIRCTIAAAHQPRAD